ncbi:MAG: hypothetical protein ACLFU0_01755 [Alphaproteobacteria bacterium]
MPIVITGGAGVFGTRLARAILDQEGVAIGGDYRSLERLRPVDLDAPAGFGDDPRLEPVAADLIEPSPPARSIDPPPTSSSTSPRS